MGTAPFRYRPEDRAHIERVIAGQQRSLLLYVGVVAVGLLALGAALVFGWLS